MASTNPGGITVNCPTCQRPLLIGPELSGRTVACPHCGGQTRIQKSLLISDLTSLAPPEPHWWLSIDGQTMGPYNRAYIVSGLSNGQIPKHVLLCLDGDRQWLPIASWPQFIAFRPQAPPQPPATIEPGIGVRVNSQAHHRTEPARNLGAVIPYAMVFSPVLLLAWASLFAVDFDPTVNSYADLVFVLFIVGIEAVPRGLLLLGAFKVGEHKTRAADWMLIGSVGLAVVLTLKLGVFLCAGLLFTRSTGPPRPVFVIGTVVLLFNAVELFFQAVVLSSLSAFRRAGDRRGGPNP